MSFSRSCGQFLRLWANRVSINSVATTSTKSPAVIKQDIKRVLDRMQIQYRETKSGFECIHAPSIDINSIVDSPHTPQRGHRKQGSSGSGETETTRKSITRKSSKMSFGKRSRDREKVVDATIKDRGAVAGAAVVAAVSVPGASEREKDMREARKTRVQADLESVNVFLKGYKRMNDSVRFSR